MPDNAVLKRFDQAVGLSVDERDRVFKGLSGAIKGGKLTETDMVQAIREWGRINRVANDNACVGGSNACF